MRPLLTLRKRHPIARIRRDMGAKVFRTPTELERAFLRIVTLGHSELERQIESCEIADYDATGWCDVNVLEGAPSPIRYMVDGPELITEDYVNVPFLQTLLWTNERGMLSTIEVLVLDRPADPYDLFVQAAAANPPRLRYPSERVLAP